MHNPTKFFIRLEFKDGHVDEIMRRGWYAWERVKRSTTAHTGPVEVLVGGTRTAFLDFVRFERAAVGLSPGDRQLLSERPELFSARRTRAADRDIVSERLLHPLAKEFALEPEQILELIAGARRLKMAVRGWVAEEHLKNALVAIPGVTSCERLDEEGGPDIRLSYKGGPLLTLECKNVLRVPDRNGVPRIDFQRTRASKSNPCSRYYSSSDFDIVAGCLHAVKEEWEFKYAISKTLRPHATCAGKLASNVRVDDQWSSDPTVAFEAVYKS
jgi:hypothetical protein